MHWLVRSSSFSKAQGLRETGPCTIGANFSEGIHHVAIAFTLFPPEKAINLEGIDVFKRCISTFIAFHRISLWSEPHRFPWSVDSVGDRLSCH